MVEIYDNEKFNRNNFSLQKMNMKVISRKNNCLTAIGEMPIEITDDDKWNEMEGNVIVDLHLTLTDGVLSNLTEKKTIKEIYNTLTRLYEAKSLHNKIFLKMRLYTLHMAKSTSVTDHINTLKTLLSQLTKSQTQCSSLSLEFERTVMEAHFIQKKKKENRIVTSEVSDQDDISA